MIVPRLSLYLGRMTEQMLYSKQISKWTTAVILQCPNQLSIFMRTTKKIVKNAIIYSLFILVSICIAYRMFVAYEMHCTPDRTLSGISHGDIVYQYNYHSRNSRLFWFKLYFYSTFWRTPCSDCFDCRLVLCYSSCGLLKTEKVIMWFDAIRIFIISCWLDSHDIAYALTLSNST